MAKSVIPAESEPLRLNQLLAHIDVIHNEATMTLIEAIDDAVAETVRACAKLTGKGSVTIALTFKPEKGRMIVGASVKAKKPEFGSMPFAAFIDQRGRLVEEDPNQVPLPFPSGVRTGGDA